MYYTFGFDFYPFLLYSCTSLILMTSETQRFVLCNVTFNLEKLILSKVHIWPPRGLPCYRSSQGSQILPSLIQNKIGSISGKANIDENSASSLTALNLFNRKPHRVDRVNLSKNYHIYEHNESIGVRKKKNYYEKYFLRRAGEKFFF